MKVKNKKMTPRKSGNLKKMQKKHCDSCAVISIRNTSIFAKKKITVTGFPVNGETRHMSCYGEFFCRTTFLSTLHCEFCRNLGKERTNIMQKNVVFRNHLFFL